MYSLIAIMHLLTFYPNLDYYHLSKILRAYLLKSDLYFSRLDFSYASFAISVTALAHVISNVPFEQFFLLRWDASHLKLERALNNSRRHKRY